MKIDTGMSRLGFDAENENTVLMVENWRRAAVCTSLASLPTLLWQMRTPQ